jgi:hypothetical protein
MNKKPIEFPIGNSFLELTQNLASSCGAETDKFCASAGKRLPRTIEGLGSTLSILYRLACCYYGCRGGDHQLEWLTGKLVNQALSAYALVRSGQYDEALTLIRGAGEIVNLFWLFSSDEVELEQWRAADDKTRIRLFGPGAVRRRLKSLPIGPPVDEQRYSALCTIGTHPTPMQAPGHYTGTGRPVLGAIVQEMGIFVCINELAYAVSMAFPVGVLVKAKREIVSELKQSSIILLETIGNVTVLNYKEGLREVHARAKQHK